MENPTEEFYSLSREERGKLMLDEGKHPRMKGEQVYVMPSQFRNGLKYRVVEHYDHAACTCPDYRYRQKTCKHIFAVKFWKDLRQYISKEGLYEGTEQALPTCAYCNSLQVVKNGKRGSKQRFLCESCHKTFVANPEFKGISVEPKVVVLCIDLALKGLSLRKIKDTLKQFYSVDVTHETVRQWKNRFMAQINNFVAEQKPELRGVWHTDETKVKTKKGWMWVWNSLDEETRFLVASTVSKERGIKDARAHFKQAKQNNADARPCQINTDGLHAYHKAINKEFKTVKKETVHKRSIGFIENQHVERLNGTQRERTKVFRGLADEKSLLRHSKDFRTFYNFVRPNQALNGVTPAEKAGINLKLGNNKWLSLIKQSNNIRTGTEVQEVI